MSSGRLASTVCPHVGCKADLSSTTSAADCADQVARWGCVFRAGVSLIIYALLYIMFIILRFSFIATCVPPLLSTSPWN